MRPIQLLFASAALLLCVSAQAQWQWLDNSGRKVYSDQPPPTSIPDKNILKKPRGAGKANVAPAPVQPVAAGAAAPAPALQLSNTDEELLARKKQAQAEVEAKIKAEAQRQAEIRATNCKRAQGNQASMDSGVRVSITNDKGEREFLDDDARAAQQKKISKVIETNCN